MESKVEQLGKVCFTVDKEYHNINRDYDKLVIVESYENKATYASRKPVPKGTSLDDREYWIKFSSLAEHIEQNYNVIQQELNELYNKVGVGINFYGDYSTFDFNSSKTITLNFNTVNSFEKASVVKLYQNDTLMDTYTNISEFTKEVTVSSEVTFKVIAKIGNYTFAATWEVTTAYNWYIGGGATYQSMMIDSNKHSGTEEPISSVQTITVNHTGDYIFICVQKNMILPEITMGGFPIPFDDPYNAIVDGVEYNIYKSSNSYKVGTYVIKLGTVTWDNDDVLKNLLASITGFSATEQELDERLTIVEEIVGDYNPGGSHRAPEVIPTVDEEDLTIGSDNVFKFKNRPNTDGMGMIILRKDKTFEEQLTQTNTIYIIQYDFTLGEDITVPANCVLKFEGGSISGNQRITFTNTYTIGSKEESFKGCHFGGTIANEFVNVRHFGITPSLSDCSILFNEVMEILEGDKVKKVYIPAGKYTTYHPIFSCNNVEIYGDGENTEIYNAQTTESDKHIFVCGSYPSLETGAARNNATDYTVSFISDDRRNITVSSGQNSHVGNICALFALREGSTTSYYFTFVAKILSVEGNVIELDNPVPYVDTETIYYAPDARGTYTDGFVKENVYIHDMYLHQLTGVASGYYAISAGYNCRFENLKIHASTVVGSNIAAYCVYKNIVAEIEAGFWDDAELAYGNLYENIVIHRCDARLNVIGFNVTNGSYNTFKNITLFDDGEHNITIGGKFSIYNKFENIRIINSLFHNRRSNPNYIILGRYSIIKGLYFEDCSVVEGSDNYYLRIMGDGGIADGVYGIFDCANDVTPVDRFYNNQFLNNIVKVLNISNIKLNKEFHKHSSNIAWVDVNYNEINSSYAIYELPKDKLWNEIKYGDITIHSKFNLLNSEASLSGVKIEVRFGEVYNNRITIPISYTGGDELEGEIFITTDGSSTMKARLMLKDNKGFIQISEASASLLSLTGLETLYYRVKESTTLKTTFSTTEVYV